MSYALTGESCLVLREVSGNHGKLQTEERCATKIRSWCLDCPVARQLGQSIAALGSWGGAGGGLVGWVHKKLYPQNLPSGVNPGDTDSGIPAW